jgi:hypothetical protein
MSAVLGGCAELAALLRRTQVGEVQLLHGLALVALRAEAEPQAGDPEADMLEESIASGLTSVAEVNEAGVVGRVRVTHLGARSLLLLDGEQILGAKQNRIVNASFLVGPGRTVDVPVSCVERGRWASRSRAFAASGTTLTGLARAQKATRVTTSLGLGRGYDADQRAVWRDVDGYLERTQTRSTTAAYHDAYAGRAAEVERVVEGIAPCAGQVGLAAVHAGKLVSVDLFGSSALYAKAWRKVVRGLVAEVYESAAANGHAAARGVVEHALQALERVPTARQEAPGGGETVFGEAGGWVLSAIVSAGRVYHALGVASAA